MDFRPCPAATFRKPCLIPHAPSVSSCLILFAGLKTELTDFAGLGLAALIRCMQAANHNFLLPLWAVFWKGSAGSRDMRALTPTVGVFHSREVSPAAYCAVLSTRRESSARKTHYLQRKCGQIRSRTLAISHSVARKETGIKRPPTLLAPMDRSRD